MVNSQSILIVDDSVIIQQTTKLILLKAKFEAQRIYFASNAQDAIKLCQRNVFDIIFIDFNLGIGSTGLQLLERIHHNQLITHHPLIFIVTADDSESILMGFSEYQPTDYLIKPFRLETLTTRINVHFNKHKFEDSVFNTYQSKGWLGVQEFIENYSSCDKYWSSVTTLAKRLLLNKVMESYGDIEVMLNSLLQQNDYVPAKLLLAQLWLEQDKFDKLTPLLSSINSSSPQQHLTLLDLKARSALKQNRISIGYEFWLAAHKVSRNNLYRLFGLIWIEFCLQHDTEIERHIREACFSLRFSIWDKPQYYAFLVWIQLQQHNKKNKSVEKLWGSINQQQKLTKHERAYVYLLKAYQATENNSTLIAYREFMNALNYTEHHENNVLPSEFLIVALSIAIKLSMHSYIMKFVQKLTEILNLQPNDPHNVIKKMWLKAQTAKINENKCAEYNYALQLVKQKQFATAGKLLITLWPLYRFDITLARCIVELFARGYLNLYDAEKNTIIEARWVFESQDIKPEWYKTLKNKHTALNKPLSFY
ncbi:MULTISPECIES: response regulator [unclassified Photobacterium]|uniref:response regulator n=1 Tax=unclassified Photobacterium TaxID=2628852 RepID=UPI001EDDEDF9|nr:MULTISPECIES: response regulator [unclassified Photobacterium]MCG3864706.1 response regulator [Photobacterium sp. Ph6]MCG3876830.1 response regulator [Photobacterium sp. Ph5]